MPDSDLSNEVEPRPDTASVKICLKLIEMGANRRFQFQKRGQLFIPTYNKAFGVLAFCGHNPKLPSLVIRTWRYNHNANRLS